MSSHDYSTDSTDRPDPQGLDGLLPDRDGPGEGEQSAEETARRVDQVAIRKLGGFNFLDPYQWVDLDRGSRLKLIKKGSVIFLFEGEEVPIRSALLHLQAMTVPGGTHEPRPSQNPMDPDPGNARPGEV